MEHQNYIIQLRAQRWHCRLAAMAEATPECSFCRRVYLLGAGGFEIRSVGSSDLKLLLVPDGPKECWLDVDECWWLMWICTKKMRRAGGQGASSASLKRLPKMAVGNQRWDMNAGETWTRYQCRRVFAVCGNPVRIAIIAWFPKRMQRVALGGWPCQCLGGARKSPSRPGGAHSMSSHSTGGRILISPTPLRKVFKMTCAGTRHLDTREVQVLFTLT